MNVTGSTAGYCVPTPEGVPFEAMSRLRCMRHRPKTKPVLTSSLHRKHHKTMLAGCRGSQVLRDSLSLLPACDLMAQGAHTYRAIRQPASQGTVADANVPPSTVSITDTRGRPAATEVKVAHGTPSLLYHPGMKQWTFGIGTLLRHQSHQSLPCMSKGRESLQAVSRTEAPPPPPPLPPKKNRRTGQGGHLLKTSGGWAAVQGDEVVGLERPVV